MDFSGKLNNLTSEEVTEPNYYFFLPQKYLIKYFGLNFSLKAGEEVKNASDNGKNLTC